MATRPISTRGVARDVHQLGIGKINLNAVDSFGFILFFGLKDELFGDRIVTGNDTNRRVNGDWGRATCLAHT
jgi:hypothetical protein